MKRYKLLKDTPNLKAGTVFEEGVYDLSGDKFLDNKELGYRIMIESINNFDDWFEEIPEEYKRQRAKLGEKYYYVDDLGRIFENFDYRSPEDNYHYNTSNYSIAEEGSRAYKNKLIAQRIITDDAKGFVPDWRNGEQSKYYGFYSYYRGDLYAGYSLYGQYQGTTYFKTKEDLEESFKKHRKEWLTVLGME